MRPELTATFVRGDGNCFTRAVADIMGMDHADIRRFLVVEVLNNPSEYECFVDDLNDWADAMKDEGTWADGLAVKATANCLNVPIVVFRKINPDQSPTAFVPRECDDSLDLEPICVELDEAFAGCEHYSPLVKKQKATVDNVATPRRRIIGKQSPAILGWVLPKSIKSLRADDDEKINRAGETSAHIPPPSDGQTIWSPSGDVATNNPETTTEVDDWWDTDSRSNCSDITLEMMPHHSPTAPPDAPPAGASAPVEDEASQFPMEPEASIPLEPETSNSKDTIKDDVESTLLVSDDTGVAVPVAMEAESTLLVSDDTGVAVPVAMEAGAELPTRRFKNKRRKLTAVAKAESLMPTKMVVAASITKRNGARCQKVRNHRLLAHPRKRASL